MTGGIGGTLPWLTLLRDLSVKSALLLLAAWALAGGCAARPPPPAIWPGC